MGDTAAAMDTATLEKPSPAFWDKLIEDVDHGRALTNEEITKFYDEWAKQKHLDKSIEANGYQALDVMQRILEELFPAEGKEHLTVLDVGACTGHSGQRLYEMGFRKIDALDPSSESLGLARERGVYREFYNVAITAEPLDIPQDSYDAIVLLGVMGPAHIPVAAFTEMIRLVKPGGFILNLTRADYLDKCQEYASQWQPAVEGHVASGKWRVLKDEFYDVHYGGRKGYLNVFQIC